MAGWWEPTAVGSTEELRADAFLSETTGIPLPVPVLASDASRIDWEPVPGASAHVCRVWSEGLLVLDARLAKPGCDLSGLPSGAYGASVLAMSVDPDGISGSAAELPLGSAAFHVSEARLGLTRSDGAAPPILLRAAAGAYDDGIGARSLALWISITEPAGTPTLVPWSVEVVGPNLPPSAPLVLTYWASFPRLMAWVPGLPAAPGVYTVSARSALGTATAQIALGAPAWVDLPLGVTASAAAQGGAQAQWQPVQGADRGTDAHYALRVQPGRRPYARRGRGGERDAARA